MKRGTFVYHQNNTLLNFSSIKLKSDKKKETNLTKINLNFKTFSCFFHRLQFLNYCNPIFLYTYNITPTCEKLCCLIYLLFLALYWMFCCKRIVDGVFATTMMKTMSLR